MYRYLLSLLAVAVSLAGCTTTEESLDNFGDGDGTTFTISARAPGDLDDPGNPDYLDYKIERIRVISFLDGKVRTNKLYDDESVALGSSVRHTIPVGTYDFVFIANEPASITASLEALMRRTDLDPISIPAANIAADKLIPQMQGIKNVQVQTDNKVQHATINGGTPTTEWTLKLVRLAARIDVLLYASTNISTSFTGVRLTGVPDRVPDRVPLVPTGYTGTAVARTGTREYTLAANPQHFAAPGTMPTGAAWARQVVRLVVPSNEFVPANTAGNAMAMHILLLNQNSPTATMGIDDQGADASSRDYTLPRNWRIDCDGEVKLPMLFNIAAKLWSEVEPPADLLGTRILNVSDLEGDHTLTPLNALRITFSSNHPDVKVENNGTFVSGGTGTFSVESYYKGLTGTSPSNFEYTFDEQTGMGTGNMTIMLVDTPPANGTFTHTIVLNAGGLKREIKLNSLIWGGNNDNKYVGTFHRASEVGERIIHFVNTGPWTATVSYPGGTSPFVNMSSEPSHDPMAGTDTPGDPERFPVVPEGDGQSVSGTGKVHFRVGMKSRLSAMNPDMETAPRYAVITVRNSSTSAEITRIYVRQGEAADYVMPPTAPDGPGSNGNMDTRSKSVKLLPYNLTAVEFNVAGGVDNTTTPWVNVRPDWGNAPSRAVTTSYPSQVGALFKWAHTEGVRAYHPSGETITGSDPNITVSDVWDDIDPLATSHGGAGTTIGQNYESCPEGYRRPNDGSTSAFVTNALFANSEIHQSLIDIGTDGDQIGFHNPPTNVTRGFYADGFFDRRPIVTPVGSQVTLNSAINSGNSTIATIGNIYYHPVTYHSLFLPSGGFYENTGLLRFPGNIGLYLTSSSLKSTEDWSLHNSRFNNLRYSLQRDRAVSIRCVQEPKLVPPTIPTTVIPSASPLLGTYVGAFWRADQTGERIISIPVDAANSGYWTAQVYSYGIAPSAANFATDDGVTTEFKKGDILLSADMSSDPYLHGSANPAQWTTPPHQGGTYPHEVYTVDPATASASVSGKAEPSGRIFFRIGLKTAFGAAQGYDATNNPARYAVIVLSYAGTFDSEGYKHRLIFLRQGHDPDYVIPNGEGATGNRTVAVRFSPFNTTVQPADTANFKARGWVLMGLNNGYHTDYPSQAGAFFHFSTNRYAYHPTFQPTTEVLSWGTGARWDNNVALTASYPYNAATMETCPTGYRRYLGSSPPTDEMAQSAWKDVSSPTNNSNIIQGYLADGYFDRRYTTMQPVQFNGTSCTVVAPDTKDIACFGAMLYNDIEGSSQYGASIFFPYMGSRAQPTGLLQNVGAYGYYWSSAHYNSYTIFRNNQAMLSGFTGLSNGFSLRCVKN